MQSIPEGLATYRQFIVWIAVPSTTRPGKTDKWPVHPQAGYRVNGQDPANWMSFEEARALDDAYTPRPGEVGHGVGFVFTENDPFFFFDLDGAAQGGEWHPRAVDFCKAFAGCYIEVSQSGTGLHIIGSAQASPHGHNNGAHGLDLELYTQKRFCALTGTSAQGNALVVAQPQFDWLVTNFFPRTEQAQDAEWTDGPVPEWSGPTDDDALIEKMLASRPSAAAAFGARATFKELWEADEDAMARCFPDKERPFDHSAADLALCTHLAFWTGKDCERIDRLFRRSALYREKWERQDYREDRCIKKGVGFCNTVLGAGKRKDEDARTEAPDSVKPRPVMDSTGTLRDGFQYMSITEQQEHFAGCVYVQDQHAVLTPEGFLLKSEQFRVIYGGYLFALDMCNDKTTKSAWECFTESQCFDFPKVHSTCFRPELVPGTIVEEEGRRLVNTYVPIETRRVAGDPSPFLNHMARMLPDPQDLLVLLCYMAAIVQYPGKKFMWAPLIQGVKGNGKSMMCDVLAYAVGSRYTELPDPNDISNKFNAWLVGKLLIVVDEAYVADRRDMENCLKRLITGKRVAIQGKGDNQVTGDNRANFILNSNFKTAVRVDDEERRYAVLFTAQQEKEDLDRDGMGGDYFPRLIAWLELDGYAILNDYLHRYQILDALNPATLCHRAPVTSATPEAIRVSRGAVEQEVIEAVEEGRPGFAGGWISSLALDKLLEDRRMSNKVPRTGRRDLLRSIGYDWHPALVEGRVTKTIPCPSGHGKPRLYVRKGQLIGQLRGQDDIIRYYLEAQQGATMAAEAFAAAGAQGAGK